MMMPRKFRQLAVGILAVAGPSAASAQLIGAVTTGPLAVGAPALGGPVLAVLALALAAGAVLMLRRAQSGARVIAMLALLLAAAAGRAAVLSVIVEGDECGRITTQEYSPTSEILLINQCDNSVRVLDIQLICTDAVSEPDPIEAAPTPPCEIGLVLSPGDDCALPLCLS
jgi:hypothetical protein